MTVCTYAPCEELSMGMSNDYPIAIEEGATFVRIGTKLVVLVYDHAQVHVPQVLPLLLHLQQQKIH
jgi:hypothetical protein